MSAVHVVMPAGVDDASRPSGGNVYDRRLCEALRARGLVVHEHLVRGDWPWPRTAARRELREALAAVPDGAVVVVDGLLASTSPDAIVPESCRLQVVVLMHMPLAETTGLGDPRDTVRLEHDVLNSARAVVVPSVWTRNRLLARYPLEPSTVHVVPPGVDPAPLAQRDGRRLLCVAAVTPGKGIDVLVEALALVRDRDWSCDVAGSTSVDPRFVADVRKRLLELDLADRVRLLGALDREALAARYAAADLLVSASRAETYGMAITEALARGMPVVAAAVGGVREALGTGETPGIVVDAEDAAALADALRRWSDDAQLRSRLRGLAEERRRTLTGWDAAAAAVAALVGDRTVEAAA